MGVNESDAKSCSERIFTFDHTRLNPSRARRLEYGLTSGALPARAGGWWFDENSDLKRALAACFRRPPEPNPRSRSAPGQRLSAIWQSKGGMFRQHHDDEGGKDTQNRRFFDSVLFAYTCFLATAMPSHPCLSLRK